MVATPAPSESNPSYRVPSMAEIVALPWNGLTVASTFSGAGGSCLGYRMAGYRVVWANELVPIAAESYRANAPTTVLDTRDIRTVTGAEILEATGLAVGELDLLDGSPPCQPFSTAGKREKSWGQVRDYGDHKQRADDLFYEYVRLVDELRPRAFVAENVSGLVKGTAKGYFKRILAALKACGYVVEARLLDAQWLGVPQARQRIIFVGVREDLGRQPAFPSPLPYRYSVRDALPWIGTIDGHFSFEAGESALPMQRPFPTVAASGAQQQRPRVTERVIHDPGGQPEYSRGDITDSPSAAVMLHPNHFRIEHGESERRKFTIGELRRICAFPDDFVLCGSYAEQWARLGNAVPPVMMRHIAETIRDRILAPEHADG